MKITHENGTTEYITMERADEPVEQGTPINRILFESIKNSIVDAKSKLDVFATPPVNPVDGQIYCDTFFNDVFIYVAGKWQGLFFNYKEFTEDLIPSTGWAGDSTMITATNDYGVWKISNNKSVSTTQISRMFDDDESTTGGYALTSNTEVLEIEIEAPSKIKVNEFTVIITEAKDGYIYGYDSATGTWEVLTDMIGVDFGNQKRTYTLTSSSDKYYTKFKISLKRFSSSYKTPKIYEFEIKKGEIVMLKN